jgi:hypothetical protein
MFKKMKVISILLVVALIVSSISNVPSFAAVDTANIVDFNDQAYPSNWNVTEPGIGTFASRDDSGDYYLRYAAEWAQASTPIKATIIDAPAAASEVDFTFDWRPERARAGGGYIYVSLRDGDNIILDFVSIGNWSNDNKSQIGYRVGTGTGTSFVNLGTVDAPSTHRVIDESMTNLYGGPNSNASLACWYTVDGNINFSEGKVEFTIKNHSTSFVSELFVVDIANSFKNFNALEIGWQRNGNNHAGERLGVDNFGVAYTELSLNDIASITQPAAVTIYQGDNDVLVLPTEAIVALGDGSEVTLAIDNNSWDEGGYDGAPGTYTYTADLVLPNSYSNSKNLQVNMTVVYREYGRRDILSIVDMPGDVNIYAVDYSNYVFPSSVLATFGDGSTSEVVIDSNTWIAEPEFDPSVEAVYTWSANLAPGEGDKDPKGLQVEFSMNYILDKPDYDLFDDFTLGVWSGSGLGKDVHSHSGTGAPALTREQDSNGNYYMLVNANNNNWRMQSMPGLSSESRKGATVSFDYMPRSCQSGHLGEIVFISSANSFPYFGLQFGSDMEIKYYNEGQNVNSSWASITSGESLTNAISKNSAAGTGIIADGSTWFSVTLDFDYFAHTAKLNITTKDDPSNPLFEETIGIYASAVNASRVGLGGWNGRGVFGIDNIGVKYVNPAENDIVEVVKPRIVTVSASEWDSYVHPTSVTIKLGDGSATRVVNVGEWTCSEFDKNQYGIYTWSAELIGLSDIENPKNLAATYEVNYIDKHYVTAALDVDALELTDYNDFDSTGEDPTKHTWPKETRVKLSSGQSKSFKVDSWIPAVGDTQRLNRYVQIGNNGGYLDENVEGIYVFKGKVVPDEGYLADEIWVYFRINYFNNDTSGYYQHERAIENLDRGLYALPSVTGEIVNEDGVTTTSNGVFISWRILVDEYKLVESGSNIVFDLIRNGTKIATLDSTYATNVTSYHDTAGNIGDVYYVVSRQGSKVEKSTSFTVTEKSYIPIAVQRPNPIVSIAGSVANYNLNDYSAADIDGDGEYEFIVKWMPSNGFDSGKAERPSSPTIFDCYKMDGTAVWRLYMGHSVPSGAHFNQFIFYDLDLDGKAEFGIKTGDGTRMYVPNAAGNLDMSDESTIVGVVGNPDLEGTRIQGNGHVTSDANEYYTVFNGLTGAIIDTIMYPHPTVDHNLWGDGWGNRSGRFNANLGYIQKNSGSTETIPTIFENRGYYARTEVAAITLRDGKLNVDWDCNIPGNHPSAGKGNHNTSVGDMDNDGYDEITLGSIAIDHDGTILWSQNGENNTDNLAHGDAIHLTAAFPDRSQLYVFGPQEHGGVIVNYALTNGTTGARVVGHHIVNGDVGRGLMANITSNPGYEIWASNPNSETPDQVPIGGIYNVYGNIISEVKPVEFAVNWRAYWDGDLLSELPESYKTSSPEKAQSVFKYNEYTNELNRIAVFEGTRTNNWTKNTPGLSADLLGDWREEIVVPVDYGHDTAEIRIYATTMSTDYTIYSLMQDPVYRSAVAAQNSAYNQPPHLSYYLGEDQRDKVLNFELPTYNFTYTWSDPISAVVEPSFGSFDKNVNNQADVVTTITWNDAIAVTDIKAAGVTIGSEAYAVSGSALTIKKEYLALQSEGNLELTVEFDKGEEALFTIVITETDSLSAIINPGFGSFDKNVIKQADVVTTITWNDAIAVTDIKAAGVSIGAEAYEVSESAIAVSGSALAVSGSALTIKKEYLALQPNGGLLLTVEFDQGEEATLLILITDTTEATIVSAIIDPIFGTFDKNVNNQADVVTAITWNDAISVTDIKKTGVSIGAEAYAVSGSAIAVSGSAIAVSGSALVIKKEYLAMQSEDSLVLTVEFEQGDAANFVILLTDSTVPVEPTIVDATINPFVAGFDRYFARRSDVTTSIAWNDATSILDIKRAGTSIGSNAYRIEGNQLIINKEYLAGNRVGNLELIVEFNVGNTALLVIHITDTTPVTPPVIPTPTPTPTPTPVIPTPVPSVTDKAKLDGIKGTVDITIFEPDDNGNLDVKVELSMDEILKDIEENGSLDDLLEITVPVSSNKLLKEMENEDVKEVSVSVLIPNALKNNDKANTNINLDKDLLQAAKGAKKNLNVTIVDEMGRENYTWSFTGEDFENSNQEISGVNLSLKVESLENEALFEENLFNEETKGLVLNFSHEGILPAQASVKVYVGNQDGIKAGDRIYLYHYNENTGKLETLPYSSGYVVTNDGYITVNILQCSDYVVLPEKADSKLITSLKNQISITPTSKTLYVGGTKGATTNIQVNLPVTLELVDDLKDETASSAVGAVTVSYKSSNNKVATVDSHGNVTAISEGVAYITTNVKLYSGKTKTVITTIIVKEPYIKSTKSASSMKVGENFIFEAKAYGLDIKYAKWSTTEKSVVVINKKTGKAIAKSKGTDYVVVRIGDVVKKIKVVVN